MGRSRKAFIESTSSAPRYTEANLPESTMVGKLSQEDLDAALANGELGGEDRETTTTVQNLGRRSAEDVAKFNAEEAPKYAKKYGGTYEMKQSGNLHRTWKSSAPDWKRAGFNSAEEHAKELHALYTEDLLTEQAERKSALDKMNAEPAPAAAPEPEKPVQPVTFDGLTAAGGVNVPDEEKLAGLKLARWSIEGQRKKAEEEKSARNRPAQPISEEEAAVNERIEKQKADWQKNIDDKEAALKVSKDWLNTHAVKDVKLDKKTGNEVTEYRPHNKDAFREHAKKHPELFPGHDSLDPEVFDNTYKVYTKTRGKQKEIMDNLERGLKNLRKTHYEKPYAFAGRSSVFQPGEADPKKVTSEDMEKWSSIAVSNKDEKMATQLWQHIYSRESGHQGIIPMRTPDRRSENMADVPEELNIHCINKKCFNPVSKTAGGNACDSCEAKGIDNPRVSINVSDPLDDKIRVGKANEAMISSAPQSREEIAKIEEQKERKRGPKGSLVKGLINQVNNPTVDTGPSKEELEDEEVPTGKDFEEIDEYANSPDDEERKTS